MDKRKKHVIIIAPDRDVFTNPTLDLFIKQSIHKDLGVVLIAPEQFYVPEYARDISFLPELTSTFKLNKIDFRSWLGLIRKYARSIIRLMFISKSAVIGVDPVGFVAAARLNLFLRSKLGYFSFEMLFKDEIEAYKPEKKDGTFLRTKELEEAYFSNLDFLMIQDKLRLAAICEENKHKPSNIFLIPVSGDGTAIEALVPEKEELKSALGIPLEKKIVVFSGSIQKWTGLHLILETFEEKWDDRFWLLVHTRVKMDENDPFYIRIMQLQSEGHSISLHNKPFENMNDLAVFISSCDFGLVTHQPFNHPLVGKNISEIGLASGKFSMCMMLGLPIIATKCTTYEELVSQYDFGVLVDKVEDVGEKSHLLLDDRNDRVSNCIKLYDEYLYPGKEIESMLNYIAANN